MAGYIGSKASVVSSGAERKKTFTITGATTSLTGLNYTVGKVHVFQNGVRLVDGTDYTATNGTTITLTAAAQSGDNVVVISQAAFQVADLPAGTPSIDDNGNATAITIDSSENVMVGTANGSVANNSSGNVGIKFDGAQGQIQVTNVSDAQLYLNRQGTDGTIAEFRKDGTAVGGIGAHSSGTYLGTADTGIYFNGGNDSIDPYNPSVPINRDNAISLGAGSRRFKDLYLSGGVYLGGTGSANKLEDYEEGTFTPTFVSGFSTTGGGTLTSSNYAQRHGFYTKVGNTVTIYYALQLASPTNTTSGQVQVGNLPFATSTSGAVYQAASGYTATSSGAGADDTFFITFPNSTSMGMYWQFASGVQGRTGSNVGNSFYTSGTVTYFTPA